MGSEVTGTTPEPWHSSQSSEGTEITCLHGRLAAFEVVVRAVHLVGDVVAGSVKARSPSEFLA